MIESVEKIVPIIERLESEDDSSFIFGLGAVLSLFLIPGLLIGLFVSKQIILFLIFSVLIITLIGAFIMKISERNFDKKFAIYSAEIGLEEKESQELLEFWNSSNSRVRKRVKRSIERQNNVKNQ